MKINIALILSIIILFLLLIFLRVEYTINPNKLDGTILDEGIYGYNLKSENLNINGLTVQNHEIYYLLMEIVDENEGIYNYKLKKLNINTNHITEISSLYNQNSYCAIKEYKIYCNNSKSFEVYDLSLNKIFKYTSLEENLTASYAPYKDIYIKIDAKKIFLLRNKEELYQTINTDKNIFYENYYKTKDNTYVIFLDEEGYYYFYDVNNAELIATEQKNYLKYKNGLLFYDEKKYILYDLVNNEKSEYENILQKDYYYTGTVDEESKTLYLYDVISNIIFIIDLNNGTLKKIDVSTIANNNPINQLILQDNYLYVYILQNTKNFYVIDLKELNIKTIDISNYKDEQTKKIDQKIANIQENYKVTIHIKKDAIINFPDFSAEELLNNDIILESLSKIQAILSKYDIAFFDTFYNYGYNGLNIYLTGSLTPNDYSTQAANPAAYSLTFNGKYMIVIDLNQPNIEQLLCHELLHNLEFNLTNQNITAFKNWNTYNPSDFYYNNSYTSNSNFNYTLRENDYLNVYFIDNYSHTYAAEDRARIFEHICACDENSIINTYPNLYRKGLYLKEEITKYFPSLINTKLFDSIDES